MADTKGNTGRSAAMKVDTALVRELAEMLSETGLTEIEVEDGDRKIRVSRGGGVVPASGHTQFAAMPAPHGAAQPDNPGAATAEPAPTDHADAIRSPMVGTVYLAAEPGSAPFVKKGDAVKAGDTLLIVEAMKVMNPITAPVDGTVQEILVANAQPVEFDQPLIVVA